MSVSVIFVLSLNLSSSIILATILKKLTITFPNFHNQFPGLVPGQKWEPFDDHLTRMVGEYDDNNYDDNGDPDVEGDDNGDDDDGDANCSLCNLHW